MNIFRQMRINLAAESIARLDGEIEELDHLVHSGALLSCGYCDLLIKKKGQRRQLHLRFMRLREGTNE